MTIYHFYDFAGRRLTSIETDDPESEIGEISFHYGVDGDEIEFETDEEARQDETEGGYPHDRN